MVLRLTEGRTKAGAAKGEPYLIQLGPTLPSCTWYILLPCTSCTLYILYLAQSGWCLAT